MAKPKELTPELLAGISKEDTITIELADGEEYSITIRPLTVGERARIEAMAQKGMKIRGNADGPTADLSDVMKSQAEANIMVVALGMVKPEMSVSQIEKSLLPTKEISTAIKKISGMTTEDDPEKNVAKDHAEGAEFPSDEA